MKFDSTIELIRQGFQLILDDRNRLLRENKILKEEIKDLKQTIEDIY